MTDLETIDVPPDVARVSEGLRDTGYEFNTAIADIIDNSIAAGSTLVDVRVGIDYMGNIAISIGDNGCGMDRDGLINAMKYGSKRRDDPASLGKFGLGLKTASTAFCKRLSLISRADGSSDPIRATWDLDFMGQSNSWGLEIASPEIHEIDLLNEVADGKSGTLVLWEKVDRLLPDYKKSDGQPLKRATKRLLNSLKNHISMVYQRFLDPTDDRTRTLEIELNGESVPSWDPFCLIETQLPVLEQDVPVQLPSGIKTSFLVRAYILPRKEEFSSDENRVAAKVSNERQGVYVYRENRLIHGPDWLGMYKQEPHFSLLRVELSFNHQLDDAFQVDIKKSRILLNEHLYEWLRDKLLAAPRREAESRYRKGAAATAKGAAVLLHSNSGNAIHQKSAVMKTAKVTAVNADNDEVTVQNNSGETVAKLRIITSEIPGEMHISTASTLDNGVLWEAALINGNSGVLLNTGHPYYPKAYLPNKENSVVIQALDFLLWSLAQAEFNNVNDENRDAFEEFRIEVSRNLKKLVADLPDPINEGD
ncbi:MAG: ATP-binding protein [Gammaproteobacteria bacterium]|nr:ATP-binding protein [Gammaproteobacteria bacterium]